MNMQSTFITYRGIAPDDVHAFRALRLQSLRDHPDTFEISYEEAQRSTEDDLRQELAHKVGLGAFDRERLIGMIFLINLPGARASHRAGIVDCYVDPNFRGLGIAETLMRSITCFASNQGSAQVELLVSENATAALALYQKTGFEICGRIPKAIYLDGVAIGYNLMICDLTERV